MNAAHHRPVPLALTLLALAVARLCAEDRAPAPPPAESLPTVSLPTSTPPATPTAVPAANPAANPAAPDVPAVSAATLPAEATVNTTTKAKSEPAKAKADDKKAAAKPAAPPALSGRFLVVRDRIKALYGNRDEPRPPFDPRQNPFRTQAIAPAEPPPVARGTTTSPLPGAAGHAPATPPVDPNVTLLKLAAAQIKMTGFVERGGRMFLNLNQAFYKEGDVIKVTVKNQPVLLRITKLSRTSLRPPDPRLESG